MPLMLSRLRKRTGPSGPPPPSAFAAFGEGSSIGAPSTVTCPERISIGSDVQIHPGAWLSVVDEHQGRRYDPRLSIGDGCRLGGHMVVACMGEIVIGRDVLASERVFVGDTFHDYRDPTRPILHQPMAEPRPVSIGNGAFLGIGAIVLPGVTVGENAYVGAGAVVTEDVPARSVVVGNPARVVRQVTG
jgi:acetyltransferase-like isoleucine patch superfamily enzyme